MAAVAYLQSERGKSRIGLYGFSLGAAVALLTAPESPDVVAVIADSPFASLEMMALDTYRWLWVLQRPLAWSTLTLARAYPGVNPREVSPLEAARRWRGAVLLIHSVGDTQIGVHHAHALQQAFRSNPKAQTWFVEGADHGGAWALNQTEYERRVRAFLGEHLRGR